MATKQIFTLDPEVFGDLVGVNQPEDILCPTIRVMRITDRRTPVYKQGKIQYEVTPHANEDHTAFVLWLRIENHKRTHPDRKGGPILALEGVEAAEAFLKAQPIYRTKRGLRHQVKTA